jgi:hypothetical protein
MQIEKGREREREGSYSKRRGRKEEIQLSLYISTIIWVIQLIVGIKNS